MTTAGKVSLILCATVIITGLSSVSYARDLISSKAEETAINNALDKKGPEVSGSPCIGNIVLLGVVSGSPDVRDSNPLSGIRTNHQLHVDMKSNGQTYAAPLKKSGGLRDEKKQREQTGKSLEKRIPEQSELVKSLKEAMDNSKEAYNQEFQKRDIDYKRRNELRKQMDDAKAEYIKGTKTLEALVNQQKENSNRLKIVKSEYKDVKETLEPYYTENNRIITEAQSLIDKHGCDN